MKQTNKMFKKDKIKEFFNDSFFWCPHNIIFTVSLNRNTILEEAKRTNCAKKNTQFFPRGAYDISILINHDKNNVSYS